MPRAEAVGPGLLLELPELVTAGSQQMELDERLLEEARAAAARAGDPAAAGEVGGAPASVLARRYLWDPPCLSLGRFQHAPAPGTPVGGLPFDVVRRPSGGRAVLHGRDFEWSFAAVFHAPPVPVTGDGARSGAPSARRGVAAPYEVVGAAMAAALVRLGVTLESGRAEPYQRSALCFASSLRYDLLAGPGKVVAVAQARRGGAALVHGSVLERRPPAAMTEAVEGLLGEPWTGDGLAAAAVPGAPPPDGVRLWDAFLDELASALGLEARHHAQIGGRAGDSDAGVRRHDTSRGRRICRRDPVGWAGPAFAGPASQADWTGA